MPQTPSLPPIVSVVLLYFGGCELPYDSTYLWKIQFDAAIKENRKKELQHSLNPIVSREKQIIAYECSCVQVFAIT